MPDPQKPTDQKILEELTLIKKLMVVSVLNSGKPIGQPELAKLLGVNQSTVSRWLKRS